MDKEKDPRLQQGLRLEVEEVEHRTRPGCNSSSTSPLCTCPIPARSSAEGR